jgi:cell wall assembly regulator SMI1
MAIVWQRLEAQLGKKYPTLLELLRPPATVAEIVAFEALSGCPLPTEVRDSYLLHDGSTPLGHNIGEVTPKLFSSYEWCHLERVAGIWKYNAEIEDHEIPPCSFNEEDVGNWQDCVMRPWEGTPPTWLPIGQHYDDMVNTLVIDTLPGPKGYIGQVVNCHHAMQSFVAPGLSIFLETLARGLESDQVSYYWEYGGDWRYADGRSLLHDNEANPFRRSAEAVSMSRARMDAIRARNNRPKR